MVKKIFSAVSKFARKNKPQILTGMGLSGFISFGVFVGIETVKAVRLVDERKKELNVEKLPPKELLKTAAPCYIPAVISAGLSSACILGAGVENTRRTAAIATAYSISEKAFSEYKKEVVAKVGEKKEQEIAESIDQRRINHQASPSSDVLMIGDGEVLCFDTVTGRYFKSTKNDIERARNYINSTLIDENTATLNLFFSELDIPTVKVGEDIGWDIEREKLDIRYSSQITPEGKPCLVINYKTIPLYGY